MAEISNFAALPLGTYIDILAVDKDGSLSDLERQVKVIALLSGMPEDEVLHLPLAEYQRLAGASRFLLDTSHAAAPRVAKEFHLDAWTLVPVADYRRLEAGQYIDFQNLAANIEDHLVELCSVLLVPKGHRYCEGYDVIEVQNAIRDNLCVADALAISAFFFESWSKLIADSLNSCTREIRKVKDPKARKELEQRMTEARTLLRSIGDGSQASTQSARRSGAAGTR